MLRKDFMGFKVAFDPSHNQMADLPVMMRNRLLAMSSAVHQCLSKTGTFGITSELAKIIKNGRTLTSSPYLNTSFQAFQVLN